MNHHRARIMTSAAAALRRLRTLPWLRVTIAACAVAVVGNAASLGARTTTLGAGQAPVGAGCPTSGAGILDGYAAGGQVDAVTISGLPATCAGATVLVTVDNGATHVTASATLPASGPLTVTISPAVTFNAGMSTDVAVIQ